jgi:hypothetical protein
LERNQTAAALDTNLTVGIWKDYGLAWFQMIGKRPSCSGSIVEASVAMRIAEMLIAY